MAGLDSTNDRRVTPPQDETTQNALLADGTKQPWRPPVVADANTQLTGSATQEVYQRTDQPWRAGYGSVAPAYGDGQQQQQQQQQPAGNQPWRAGYGQIAPGYGDGQQQQQQQQQPQGGQVWRPGYNQVAPGAQQQDPNRNGDAPTGPKWNPNPQVTWNSPGPAQNPQIAQPGQGGQTQPGQTGKGDNLYDPHRTDIDLGLQKQIGFGGQMVIGGLSGVAFGGPIPWILNRTADTILITPEQRAAARGGAPLLSDNGLAGKVVPEAGRQWVNGVGDKVNEFRDRMAPSPDGALGKTAKWWQDNFDSRYFRRNDLVLQQTQFASLEEQVAKMVEQSKARVTALTPAAGVVPEAAQLKELSAAQSKVNWLTSEQWKENGAKQLENLKGAMNLNEKGLFTEAEMKVLADRQMARATVADITAAQNQGQKFLGENPGSNFVKGAAFVGLTMVADHYLDKIFTGKDHQDGLSNSSMTDALPLVGGMTKSWNTNSLLVPMAFTAGGFSGKGLATKIAYTGAALVGGKVLDSLLPASDHQSYSNWLRPTGFDSVLMGAAFMLPAAENKTRLAMIGGAWVAGRIYNMFEGPSKGDIKDQGFDKMKTDMKDRTAGSMGSAMDSFKELGEKDNYALRLYTSDWLRPNRQYDGMLSAYRGAVILAGAFGESRLDKGTLLPNSQKDFILPGKDLDIGGQATRALIIAQVNVDRAKQQTQNEMGKDEKGKKVSEQELKDLDQIGARINNTMQNRIYGKHDIQGAVNDLADFYKGDEKDMLLMKMDIDNSLALNRGSKNTQFTAKLFRDQACILLAAAQLKASGPDAMGASDVLYGTAAGRQTPYNNGQPRGYDGALDAIALAKQLDPNNPDNVQLEQIANQLKQRLPQQVQAQQSSTTFNPLNVNDQVNNPGSQNPIGQFGAKR
ncbi:MAG: hypothetical protein JST89_09780 [Cyanobacteria bacterium SZAS-4]|nr:hypothetical protein [Cyanobacteria bacterium SZAS-4]